jgi:hypothetical protein
MQKVINIWVTIPKLNYVKLLIKFTIEATIDFFYSLIN